MNKACCFPKRGALIALALLVAMLLSSCGALLDSLAEAPSTDAPSGEENHGGMNGSSTQNGGDETDYGVVITWLGLTDKQKNPTYLAPDDKQSGVLEMICNGKASDKDIVAKTTAAEVAHAEPLYVDGQQLVFRTVAKALGRTEIWFETADGKVKSERYTVVVTPHGLASEDSDAPQTDAPVETKPAETTAPDENEIRDGSLVLLGVTEKVENGSYARVQIQGKPGVSYDIAVYYSTTVSSASGLGDKVADEDGYVSWTWKVGANTNSGSHRIVVSGGGERIVFYFYTYR